MSPGSGVFSGAGVGAGVGTGVGVGVGGNGVGVGTGVGEGVGIGAGEGVGDGVGCGVGDGVGVGMMLEIMATLFVLSHTAVPPSASEIALKGSISLSLTRRCGTSGVIILLFTTNEFMSAGIITTVLWLDSLATLVDGYQATSKPIYSNTPLTGTSTRSCTITGCWSRNRTRFPLMVTATAVF